MTETIQTTSEVKPEQSQPALPPIKHLHKQISHRTIFVCGVIALLLLGFISGQAFERARIRHSTRWQNNYQQNFFGDQGREPRGMMRQDKPGPIRSHAILGTILSINGNSVSIQDNDGNVEQVISISNSTVIQNNNGKGSASDLQQGQKIAIFGRPAGNGQIDASLIRILNNTPPTPSASTSPAIPLKN
jgi:hypothetical protein